MPSSVGVSSSSLTNTTTSTTSAQTQTTELSAAITFLGEEALLQACDILVAQSNALFGTSSTATNDGKSADTAKSENTSHVNQLTQLHEKVKTAQDTIIKADEAGTLNDTTSNIGQQGIIMRSDSGLSKTNPSPSMNHRNSLVNVASSIKPVPNLSRGNSSISNNNTTPSLHRSRSSSLTAHGGGGVGASGSKNQALLSGRRQKMPNANNTTESKVRALNRLPSDTSDSGVRGDGCGGGKVGGKKAQPPPEVLNFLKALNSSKNSCSPASGDGSTGGGNAVGERLASFAGVDIPSSSTANTAKKRPPPPPSHPPSSSKKGRPTTKRVARGQLLAPSSMSDKTPAKGNKDRPSSSEKTPATKTPSDKTSSSSSGQRSGRSSRRSATPSSSEKIYEIGADVNVLMDGKQYGGIVKNVDYGSDDSGSDKGAMYEVEFEDGEIWDVNPRDMTEKEDEW